MEELWLIKDYHDEFAGYNIDGDEVMNYTHTDVGVVEASKDEIIAFLKKWDNFSHTMKAKRIQVVKDLESFIPYRDEEPVDPDERLYLEF